MIRLYPLALVLALALNLSACSSGSITVPEDCQALGNNIGADQTAPTVAFVQPDANAMIGGVVALTATATDNCGISAVRFTIYSGAPLGTATRGADGHTYTLNWDTGTVANGPITLAVYADDTHRDLEGNPTPNSGFQSREFTVANP